MQSLEDCASQSTHILVNLDGCDAPAKCGAPVQQKGCHGDIDGLAGDLTSMSADTTEILPEKFQLLQELFNLADNDGSGSIDVSELTDLLSKLGLEATPAEVQAMMAAVDIDNSGSISLDELWTLMGPRLEQMAAKPLQNSMRLAFDHIDSDGSGGVSQAEVKELLVKLNLAQSMSDEKLTLLFCEIDSDGTGEIGFELFAKLFTNAGLVSNELVHAVNLLFVAQDMRKSFQAVTGFAAWGELRKPAAYTSKVFIFDAVCQKLVSRCPSLRVMSAINGTMVGFALVCSQHPLTRWADAFFRGAGQVVFANNPVSGAFIVAALFLAAADGASLAVAICGVLGLFSATAAAVFLQMDQNALQSGLFGYNGCLAGLGVATFLVGATDWSAGVFVISALLGALSTVLNLSLGNLLVPTFRTPPFTLAFNMVNWLFVLAAAEFSRFQRASFLEPMLLPLDGAAFSEEWPSCYEYSSEKQLELACSNELVWMLKTALISVGQIFLCESAVSGALIIVGVFLCSRILALSLYGGALAGVLIALALGAPLNEVEMGLWGYNASLGAAAVMTFFYPNRQSSFMALVSVFLCILLDGAFKAVAAPLGMPVGTVPFCLAAIAMMLIYGGVPGFEPVPLADVSTPEDHLFSFGDKDVERARLLL